MADFEDPTGWNGGDAYDVDRAGLYLLTASARWAALSASGTPLIGPAVNGTRVIEAQSATASSAAVGAVITTLVELDLGDQVSLQTFRSLTLASTLLAVGTHLALTRVGPVRWT